MARLGVPCLIVSSLTFGKLELSMQGKTLGEKLTSCSDNVVHFVEYI